MHYVTERLREDWSPETMAGRLKLDHPRSACLRISPEGIYRWIYEDAAQDGFLYQHLLRRHKKRLRQQQYGTGRGLIPNRVSIHDRPLSIGNHRRLGHWEGDSVERAGLSPKNRAMTRMRFPISLYVRRSQHEEEALQRRANYWCHQAA
ncbi:IS30 family transposase [Candidatus Vondammii sp. HM_W22]|uniref:IS30 family transposase n=1 Tax=Candidatus Vondammii sp. HM_W22 TaxID=2687299 RepID=UPI00403DE637